MQSESPLPAPSAPDPAQLLVIEDDDIVARTIIRSLRGEEFTVNTAHSGAEGLRLARQARPDLVILDVIMPGMDGYTVCRQMRADPLLVNVPVLFLTAKIKEDDKIAGFRAGADDYLTKPFNIDELILRVRAILKRTRLPAGGDKESSLAQALGAEIHTSAPGGYPPHIQKAKASASSRRVQASGFTLDARTYEMETPDGRKIRLTPVQYDLLYHLMTHVGEVFSPSRLLDEVWDYPSGHGSPDLVRVHIKALRERIEMDPRAPTLIRTVPGYGYMVDRDPPEVKEK